MNKVNVLLTATLLGSTSIISAQEVEVPEIIKKLGLEEFFQNGGPPPEAGVEGGPDVVQAVPWDIPAEIYWNNDDPVRNLRLCDHPAGAGQVMDDTELDPERHMGDFEVTACGTGIPVAGTYGCETVLFKYPGSPDHPDEEPDDPSPPWGGGEADGTGWNLVQWGRQTYTLPWTIELDPGVILDSIEIDLLSKKGLIKAGFDILLRPNDKDKFNPYTLTNPHTGEVYLNHPHPSPGSGAGGPVEEQPPFAPEVLLTNYTATFYNPIVLLGYTLQDPHDLYGKVKIEFPEGLEHDTAIKEFAFSFWQDTDCLPDYEFDIQGTDGANGTATVQVTAGVDVNLVVQRVVGGKTENIAGPFYISSTQGPVIGTVTGLQKGEHYQIVDRTDTGLERVVFGPARFE